MADLCVCCGKKVGLINGSHLNNKLCDNCYFPIGGYLTPIENESDIEVIKENYNLLISKIHKLPYSESGKQYVINYAKKILQQKVDKNNDLISQRIKRDNFKITTGNNFDGYTITKYSNVVSGNIVLGTGFSAEKDLAQSNWFGDESHIFSDKLDSARDSAINRMIDNAIKIGCNAVVGIKFNYMTLYSNTIVVIVNGTAVVIEENINNNSIP